MVYQLRRKIFTKLLDSKIMYIEQDKYLQKDSLVVLNNEGQAKPMGI
jgi:hypothetical protein